MPFTEFVSGTKGSVLINSNDYAADFWTWDMTSQNIELPTVSSVPFVDNQTGLRRCVFRAGGTVTSSFNPFNPANGGAGNPYLNSYVSVTVTALSVFGKTATLAHCDNSLVIHWFYSDEADGTARWELKCVGSFRFTNMFNM